jgi:hypothetical protein
MGLAEVPNSDSIIQLIPLSVIPLSGAHCTTNFSLNFAQIWGRGRSFENRSFEFSSKTGQRMDWRPQGFPFSTFYCFPNLTEPNLFE